jgi:hypothetical protein
LIISITAQGSSWVPQHGLSLAGHLALVHSRTLRSWDSLVWSIWWIVPCHVRLFFSCSDFGVFLMFPFFVSLAVLISINKLALFFSQSSEKHTVWCTTEQESS